MNNKKLTRRVNRLAGAAIVALVALAPATALADYFGAIAYNPNNGRYGYSYDYNDRYSAESRAHAECGGGCQIAVWFRNACGALATGSSGWGSGWGDSRQRAEYEAINVCQRYTGGCRVLAWVCTTR